MKRAILIMLWLTLAALCGSDALAHAALVESHPKDGATIEGAPPTVILRFNEPVSPLVVSLTDPKGSTHRGLAVKALNGVLEISLPTGLNRGSHVLSYRVTSNDGHPIGGSVVFSIGSPTSRGSAAVMGGEGTHAAIWLSRMGFYLGLFAGVGGGFFLAWLAPLTVVDGSVGHSPYASVSEFSPPSSPSDFRVSMHWENRFPPSDPPRRGLPDGEHPSGGPSQSVCPLPSSHGLAFMAPWGGGGHAASCAVRGRPLPRIERPCQRSFPAMADAACLVPPRGRRRLLDRRLAPVGGHRPEGAVGCPSDRAPFLERRPRRGRDAVACGNRAGGHPGGGISRT